MSIDSPTIQNRFQLSEVEFTIRRMEVELKFHREQARLMDVAIQQEEQNLDRLQSRSRHSRMMEEEHN